MRLPASPDAAHALHLDTRFHIHATDATGTKMINEATGEPIHIAQDLATGIWYARVADSFPRLSNPPTAAQKQSLAALVGVGGVHVAHDNEKFRGVWVPLEEAEVELDTIGEPVTVDEPRELTDGSDPEQNHSRAVHKAAKKAAKKGSKRVN